MTEEQRTEKVQAESGGVKQFFGDLMDIAETAVMTVFVFLMLFAFTMRPVTVDGSSMNPTLYDGDQLLILTPLHLGNTGDIVVINDEESGLFADDDEKVVYRHSGLNMVIVKRVIARSGQEIDIDFETGIVSVDGTPLSEPYVSALTTRNDGAFTYPLTVPEGYVFVMGDNRPASTDSRNPAVGLVPQEQILGTAFFRYDRTEELCEKWSDRFAFLLFS